MIKNCTTCGERSVCGQTCAFPKKCKKYWNCAYAGPAVEFVSYDGSYPSLCHGTLILRIHGEQVIFPTNCLVSGGWCTYDEEEVEFGDWIVDVPDKYLHLSDEIHRVVNENVPHGCCGGCI